MYALSICIITAPSPRKAEEFRTLLQNRIDHGLYPREIDFRVYSDPLEGRVGSGGGTLLALVNLLEEKHIIEPLEYFKNQRILIIHAGGESRRMPCYAPEGKIFAPVPVATSSIIPPVLLDMQLALFLKYPWSKGEVVITSGDVVVDFDTSMVPINRGDICGFAKSASFDQGSRHGVFKFDRYRTEVMDFYQKATVDFLLKNARLEGSNDCALDMGIIGLSPDAAQAFIELANKPIGQSMIFGDLIKRGKIKFDLYLEVLTACLKHLTVSDFKQRMHQLSALENSFQEKIFDEFHTFSLTGIITTSTSFLHFGALSELHQACNELNAWGLKPFYGNDQEEFPVVCERKKIVFNSNKSEFLKNQLSRIYAESTESCTINSKLGAVMLFGLDSWQSDDVIAEGICIDQRNIDNSVITLVYGINDTFRVQNRLEDVVFCGIAMDQWLMVHGLTKEDIWDKENMYDLQNARLFCAGSDKVFTAAYWQSSTNLEWAKKFKSSQKYSIKEINEKDSAIEREKRRIEIRKQIMRAQLFNGVGWQNISKSDFKYVAKDKELVRRLNELAQKTDNELLKAYRAELINSISTENKIDNTIASFKIDYGREILNKNKLAPGIKEDQIVWARSPVRLDLAGGWSDTPPYTLRHGGQVVNVAVDLNGQPPIQVFCRKTGHRHIKIHSIDLGISETITRIEALEDYCDPVSPFGLPKAAFCLMGITRKNLAEISLIQYLDTMGCGIELTLVCAVPKGSGLGTSSILAATILAALYRFFGQSVTNEEMFLLVLQMEQMLTTGGGWQDQIGGVVGGVKYIESKAGLKPNLVIHQLDPYLFQDPKSCKHFTLFYTGITRLAKNILQEVVAQVNANTPAYLYSLKCIRQLALNVKEAIALRNLQMVFDCISRSWEANKRIHPNSSNDDVERLLFETKPFYSGVKLLGAGGGGYALFGSDSLEKVELLRNCLSQHFENEKARIVDFSLNCNGLEVTVS
jgi:Predicted kinase related to galactokinase and mevalonate kinase